MNIPSKSIPFCRLALLYGRLLPVLVAVLSVLGRSASAAERQIVRGHVPPAAARLAAGGKVQPTERLNVAIGLPLRTAKAWPIFFAISMILRAALIINFLRQPSLR